MIVVSWNAREETLGCLRNLEALPEPELRVHVVDNGSTDGSAAAVAREHPQVDLLAFQDNRGFAAAANAGLRRALEEGAEWFFLLNNDARLEDGALKALLEAAERHPRAGLLGGRIYADRQRDVLWCCGVSLGWHFNLARLRGHGRRGRGRYEAEEEVDALTGCGLLIRREVLEQVGWLDEGFWVYVEDADYCLRAREAGFAVVYVPEAVMEHAGAGSTGGGYSPARKYLTAHGSALLARKHFRRRPGLALSLLIFDLLPLPLLLVSALFRRRLQGALAKGRGLRDGILGRSADRSVVARGKS